MNSRLSTTVSTPASAAHRVPWAIVACLAWMVLGQIGTAQDVSGLPSAQPTASVASAVDTGAAGSLGRPVQFASTAAPAAATGPVLNDPAAGSLQSGDLASQGAGGESLSGPTAEELPSSGAPPESPYWTRMWRFVPRGMVPFGPRTPDCDKDRGIGIPLPGRGWRTNPFSITPFVGVTYGSPLIVNHLKQQASFYGGLNIAWDFDHYWGIEKRLGFGALNLTNGQDQPIPSTGLSVTGEYRLMYYPLGDARWRPFLTAGVGWSDFYFTDDRGANHLDTVGMIPFGVGLKYLLNDRFALRMDLIDEMTFAGGVLSDFHYAAFTVGLEVRYGHRLLNLPWHRQE